MTNNGKNQDAQGIAELDRGESVDLEDVLDKARTIVDAVEYRRSQNVNAALAILERAPDVEPDPGDELVQE